MENSDDIKNAPESDDQPDADDDVADCVPPPSRPNLTDAVFRVRTMLRFNVKFKPSS